ncbi:reverse transcriptase domain-containing protein [Tanacetum coccineum]
MWSSTRTIAPTPSFAIAQLPIHNFHIKSTHMQMIRENQFDGQIRSDPHRHIADFLKIGNLFQYGENQEEVVMLRTFPFSLTEEAKTWMNELDKETITSWNELREAFISRYFSLAKFRRLLNEIHNFYQFDNETLVDAWLRMKEILPTCYGHEFSTSRNLPLQNPNEAFKILEDKVLLKLDFLGDFKNNLKPRTVVFAGRTNINSDHAILMDKFEALATKINFEFLKIKKELKDMRCGRKDNQTSQIYMKDDTPMCEPHEANDVHRYHGGYHARKPINSCSYPNHNPIYHYPQSRPPNRMPHTSRYFELSKTSPEEMMKEWVAR